MKVQYKKIVVLVNKKDVVKGVFRVDNKPFPIRIDRGEKVFSITEKSFGDFLKLANLK